MFRRMAFWVPCRPNIGNVCGKWQRLRCLAKMIRASIIGGDESQLSWGVVVVYYGVPTHIHDAANLGVIDEISKVS